MLDPPYTVAETYIICKMFIIFTDSRLSAQSCHLSFVIVGHYIYQLLCYEYVSIFDNVTSL